MCGQQCVSPPFIHSKSRMRKRARTDLRGGRSAMVVPTATVIQVEPISNDSSESKLVGSRTASAICVVKKLVTAFQKACSVSSVE